MNFGIQRRRKAEKKLNKQIIFVLLIVVVIVIWINRNHRFNKKVQSKIQLGTGGQAVTESVQLVGASKFQSSYVRQKNIIDDYMLDEQIGGVKKSAREYYEFRDIYDDSIPECKATYYGLEWLRFMNDTMFEVCQPKPKINQNINTQSKIKCTFVHDRFPESYCLAENLAIDVPITAQFYQNMKLNGTTPEDQRDVYPTPGSIKANCEMKTQLWKREYFWNGSEKWLYEGLKANQEYKNEDECVAWVEHPVFIYGKAIENKNLFWGLNMAAEQFLAHSLFDIGLDAQIVVIDQVSDEDIKSYFGVAYQVLIQMFSPKRPPRTLDSIIQESLVKNQKNSGSVCFRKIMFNTMGFRSFLAKNNRMRTRCRNSATVNGLIDMLTDAMNITNNLPPSLTAKSPILTVVWVSRRGFSRNIQNEDEIVSNLKLQVTKLGHQFLDVEMHKMPVIEQMRLVRGTDVLVGLHGAGLTHGFVLPQTSALIEMELESRGEAYRNLGVWRNLFYVKYYHGTLTPDVNGVAGVVVSAMEQVQKRLLLKILPDGTLGPEFRKFPCARDYHEATGSYYLMDCSDP